MDYDQGSDAPKTAEELFSDSFQGDYDDDLPWGAVRALRRGNVDEVFHLAVAYSQSVTPIHRARALDVLAQLGAGTSAPERAHFSESVVAIALARFHEDNPLVARSAAWALAHLQGDAAISALIDARKCSDAQVRLAIAFGMAGNEGLDAIQTLIELTGDDDGEVRNWATFGLANAGAEQGPPVRLGAVDSPAIRDALRKRLTDSLREVRDEAIWGLALRRDPVALRLLVDRLSSKEWVAGDETAAAEVLGVDYETPLDTLRAGLRNLMRD